MRCLIDLNANKLEKLDIRSNNISDFGVNYIV